MEVCEHGFKLSFKFEVSRFKFAYYTAGVQFDVDKYLLDFHDLAHERGFACETLAEVGGYEIAAFSKNSEGAPRVYISSGIHGDEPAGVYALLEMLRDGLFDDRVEWRLCPLLNPSGLAAGTRENAQGVDLNRDYRRKTSSEVRAHADWLARQPVPEMFVSLHEDWESTGFYLYEIQKRGCRSTAQAILSAAAAMIEAEPSALIDDHKVREAGWIFHEPRADYPNDWPEAIFMAEMGTRVSYTLETPSSLPLEKRIACHKLAVRAAVEGFLLTRGLVEGCNGAG